MFALIDHVKKSFLRRDLILNMIFLMLDICQFIVDLLIIDVKKLYIVSVKQQYSSNDEHSFLEREESSLLLHCQ